MKAYLAGPDVFLPNALSHAAAKVAICEKYGIIGRPPINDDFEDLAKLPPEKAWRGIYLKDIEMMEECDIIIANLTPFRGASADAGTLIEVGWFLGRAKPIYAYSNMATLFAARSRVQTDALPDPIENLLVEGFGLPDNLMIPGAVEYGGPHPIALPPDGRNRAFDSLEIFELCVRRAAESHGARLV
jgi:nucleoside 2-deoxyribosyltransferase